MSIFFKLTHDCFTILCYFLLYDNFNQLYPSLPAPSHPLRHWRALSWAPVLYSESSLASVSHTVVVYIYISVALLIFPPACLPPCSTCPFSLCKDHYFNVLNAHRHCCLFGGFCLHHWIIYSAVSDIAVLVVTASWAFLVLIVHVPWVPGRAISKMDCCDLCFLVFMPLVILLHLSVGVYGPLGNTMW